MQTMDSRIGLDFIVENPEYIRKLAAALDTSSITVKKQVFELLSALCVYNEEGHARALDTLEHYKKLKGERYRLSLIVKELDHATVVDYQTALVAFINCLIISTPRLTDRTRLRNEFIGCHLLPVLNNLRKCAEAEPELAVQLDVFDEQRESDDAQSMQGPHGVDLNSPLDVFYAILKQVAETPQEIPFLSILQHLLRIDPKEAISDIIWDTAERLVHRATLVENREDASRLLRTPSIQSKLFCHCQHQSSQSRRQSLNSSLSIPLSPQANIPPPPIFSNAISSSSTQPTNSSTQPSNSTTQPPPPPPPPSIPSPPTAPPSAPVPPPPMHRSIRTSTQADVEPLIEKLPQQEIPQPKIKMKTINWNKIPENKVIGKNNIWTQVACSHQDSPMADMDWSEMEGLFCQQVPPSSAQSSPKLGNRDSTGSDTLERRMRKENTEVTLLDGKRSLNVNIFLKQFRSSNEDIIQLIRDGEHDDIGAEKIKGLLKILPEVDELDMLKSYNGDFSKLGNAEKFLLQLTNLPNYKLRIESMLIKEEFASNMGYLEPSINSMINAAEDLMTNKPLKEVLYMVLVAGNFLNSGGYAGNAAGVKLSSLQKITDIRANKPNMNLIHFVALQAEKRNKWLLSFTDNTSVLEDAAKTTVEQLQNEINALESRIKKNKKQIEMPSTEHDIKLQMTEFLLMAEREVAKLQRNMRQLENVRKQLADFFCEDANQFKLEECFRIFHGFYCKFKQAVAENERRRIQEEQANARRRQREELLATKRKQMGLVGAPDSDCAFVDTQIYDSRTGFPMKKGRKAGSGSNVTSEEEVSIPGSPSFNRTRLGSFNGNDSFTNASKDERSPDITPNGSLRRRRSRVLSEEDEGTLMDFLRTSGHDVNRERKSWGSLDRSWARRARGSGPRKRPALLGADFSSDRERPSSPSPLGETKPILPASEEESKPKEWRQKIESWLQANESDQVTDEARKQARRITNRRSFELDSESDRSNTLDPLPEGKQVYSGGQSSYRKVYPDWRPSKTIESTDVVGAMEAVEEAQQPPVKDKSAWRKSTLNVANSCEETKQDSLRYRHTIPRMRVSVTPEEDSRKNLIASLGEKPASDKLTLYIRRPSDTPSSDTPSHSEISERHTSYTEKERPEKTSQKDRFVKDRYVKEHHEPDSPKEQTIISNKVEIDQDNIETPPATRRIFTPSPVDKREPVQPSPCKRLLARSAGSPDDPDPNNLGDGQFDRFSAARRTRRYKKATDHAELRPAEHADVRPTDHGEVRPADHVDLSTNELIAEKEVVKMAPLHIESSTAVITEPLMDSEARLKAWQQRLKMNESETKADTKVHRRNRNQTGINQDEVKMALKISSPIDIDSEKQISKTYITPDEGKEAPRRSREDDEGFEENLSLMSESPSQGASSGGNFEPDTVSDDYKPKSEETTEKSLPKRQSITKSNISLKSTRTVDRSTRTLDRSTKPLNAPSKALDRTTKPLDRSTKPLDRSNALRHSTQEPKKSVIPRRSNSLRKTASQSSMTSQTNMTKRNLTGNNVTLNNVQRSSSRNSIGSSRTSINSVTSTNTVKRGPPLKPSNGNTQSSNRTVNRSPSIRSLNAKPAAVKTGTGSHIQRPPRPQGSTSFMKPTTASTTKASMVPTRVSSFRSKN